MRLMLIGEGFGCRRRGRERASLDGTSGIVAYYAERQLRSVLLPLFEVLIIETGLPQR